MSDAYQSLSHSRWNGKYHVVFVPKRRRKALLGNMRKALVPCQSSIDGGIAP